MTAHLQAMVDREEMVSDGVIGNLRGHLERCEGRPLAWPLTVPAWLMVLSL